MLATMILPQHQTQYCFILFFFFFWHIIKNSYKIIKNIYICIYNLKFWNLNIDLIHVLFQFNYIDIMNLKMPNYRIGLTLRQVLVKYFKI